MKRRDKALSEAKESKEKSDVRYTEYSVVKLGCNKCSDIYYSDGAYNKHLFEKHRIRNPSRRPPTIINRLWSKIPAKEPLADNQHECECGSRFFVYANLIRHKERCRKKTVEEEEEMQSSLYNLIETQQREEKAEEEECTSSEEEKNSEAVIEPTQRRRRGRSLKRNWSKLNQEAESHLRRMMFLHGDMSENLLIKVLWMIPKTRRKMLSITKRF